MKWRIDPEAAVMALWMAMREGELAGALAIAAAGHELGHLIAARAMGIGIRKLTWSLVGARMEIGGILPYRKEILLAGAGPMASGLIGALFLLSGGDFAETVAEVSLALGALNLLPVAGMDGGRMLRCALACAWSERAARTVAEILSFCTLFLLWCLPVYLLLKTGAGLSLLCFAMTLFDRFFDARDL